jgi:TRAP-type C4-dicarboxylate transport system substrate-binding protein
LTYHFYISRPVFLHRATFDAWPDDLQRAMRKAVTDSVAFQRQLAVEENESARQIIEAAGCEIVALTPAEHDAFVAAVQPLRAGAAKSFGAAMFKMVPP